MVDLELNPLFKPSYLNGSESQNLPSINTVTWANVNCDITWFVASNAVPSACS